MKFQQSFQEKAKGGVLTMHGISSKRTLFYDVFIYLF
jgi:hypothetical protein